MTPHPALVGRGVRWAVLSAFARILSPGKSRTAVRLYALNLRPAIGKQGEALVAATDLGFTKSGELTLKGLVAAGTYLAKILEAAHHPTEASELKLLEYRASYRPHLDFLAQLLAMDTSNSRVQETLTFMHEEVQALVDGAPYTEVNVLSLVQAVSHFESGINLEASSVAQ